MADGNKKKFLSSISSIVKSHIVGTVQDIWKDARNNAEMNDNIKLPEKISPKKMYNDIVDYIKENEEDNPGWKARVKDVVDTIKLATKQAIAVLKNDKEGLKSDDEKFLEELEREFLEFEEEMANESFSFENYYGVKDDMVKDKVCNGLIPDDVLNKYVVYLAKSISQDMSNFIDAKLEEVISLIRNPDESETETDRALMVEKEASELDEVLNDMEFNMVGNVFGLEEEEIGTIVVDEISEPLTYNDVTPEYIEGMDNIKSTVIALFTKIYSYYVPGKGDSIQLNIDAFFAKWFKLMNYFGRSCDIPDDKTNTRLDTFINDTFGNFAFEGGDKLALFLMFYLDQVPEECLKLGRDIIMIINKKEGGI